MDKEEISLGEKKCNFVLNLEQDLYLMKEFYNL